MEHGRDILKILTTKILAKFYITGVQSLVMSCPGFLKLNKHSFSTNMPDILQLPFSYCQADNFGPIFAYNGDIQLKLWVLVILCLSIQAIYLELLHNCNAQSIFRGFWRSFALSGVVGGTPLREN